VTKVDRIKRRRPSAPRASSHDTRVGSGGGGGGGGRARGARTQCRFLPLARYDHRRPDRRRGPVMIREKSTAESPARRAGFASFIGRRAGAPAGA